MQTNYASSRGKAKPLLWTSLKPSHQQLSWGDWRCRCFWLRTAGKCTWEPGCTGHSWAGCGWTFFLNKRGQRLPWWDAQKTRRDGAIFLYRVNTKVCSRCRAASDKRLRVLSHVWLTDNLELKAEQRYREMLSFFVPLTPLCYLDLQPETLTKHLLKSIRSLRKQTKKKIKSLLGIKISICFSWHIFPSSDLAEINVLACFPIKNSGHHHSFYVTLYFLKHI